MPGPPPATTTTPWPHPPTTAGSEPGAGRGNKGPTLITRLGPTPLPSREPEPRRSVTFPWLGLTPQRSTRGATPRQGLERAAQRQGQPPRLAGASQKHQGQIKAGPQAPSLRDIDNRIPREKNRRGWSEAEASEVLRPPAFEVIDGRLSALNLYLIDGRLSGLS